MAGSKGKSRSAAATRAKRRRVQGAALSGGALVAGQLAGQVVGAGPAQAAVIVVNSLLDNGDGTNTTLREAIAESNLLPGQTDTITFDASLSGGTIFLAPGVGFGQLKITDDVIITGPGAAALTVDGSNSDRVFYVVDPGGAIAVTISGLTVTHGNAGTNEGDYHDNGGGVAVRGETVTLDNMVITANTGAEGGGIWIHQGALIVSESTISNNTTLDDGGGILASGLASLVVTGTQVLNNTAADDGGGIDVRNGSVSIADSVLYSNDAYGGRGGALAINGEGASSITGTTISSNHADDLGGGVYFNARSFTNASLLVERSTISGNDGAEGGGMQLSNGQSSSFTETHSVTIVDSTISGNLATGFSKTDGGGGVSIHMDGYGGDAIGVTFRHTTIALNTSAGTGGGVNDIRSLGAAITLDHTIVATNTASYGGADGDDVFGSVIENWSLIGTTSGTTISSGANNQNNVAPLLGPLADNGGPLLPNGLPTLTHMIAPTSPAHNGGDPAFGAVPAGDQRGRPRISGTRIDIGAVERQTSLPAVVNQSVNWNLRDRLSAGPANLPTFSFGSTPLVPIIGDWDGDGDETPGYVKAGVFTLSNNLTGTGPFVTFSFGDVAGFPVVGNWDGDTDDEVAVFKGGTWQVRPNTNTGVVAGTSFTFGSGVWPATVPVAGDWNGDGTDGIGFYLGNGALVGSWSLRQTATTGAPDIGPFNYEPGTPAAGYPVVGDWDGDKIDTVGTKTGATWNLRNTNTAGTPDVTFDFTVNAPKDLPLVWSYGTGP